MFVKSLSTWVLATMVVLSTSAQQLRVDGGFVQDSMQIGEPVHYWLTASYDPSLEVLFPDSLFEFAPFEYLNRTYTPTSLRGNSLFDSAVYELQSFEIDPSQKLQLLVLGLKGSDTIKALSPLDSLIFDDLVIAASDTTALIANTNYLKVPRQFNYPLMYILLGALAVITLIVALVFGKKILAAWQIRRLRKEYLLFNEQLTQYIRKLKESPLPKISEEALIKWKFFMERLENQPYTKLTTKEILSNSANNELAEALKSVDRSVYGQIQSPSIYKSFQAIEDFTQHRFQEKINQIKDGAGYRK